MSESGSVISSDGVSFLDYVKSGECYREELTVYFENIPELFFSLSFRDNPESRFNSFTCYMHVCSADKEFETSGSVHLDCQKRLYYDVPEYFSNMFMRFISHIALVDFFNSSDDDYKDSIAGSLCMYLEGKGFILPDLQYIQYMDEHKAKTEIEKMMIESSKDITSLNSLVRRAIKMEIKRGVLPQHLMFLILYLRDFVLRKKALFSKWSKEKNLKTLQEEYEKSLKK